MGNPTKKKGGGGPPGDIFDFFMCALKLFFTFLGEK